MAAIRSLARITLALLLVLLCLAPDFTQAADQSKQGGVQRHDDGDNIDSRSHGGVDSGAGSDSPDNYHYDDSDSVSDVSGGRYIREPESWQWLTQWEEQLTEANATIIDYGYQLKALWQRLDTVSRAVNQDKRELARIDKLVVGLLYDKRLSKSDRQSLQRIVKLSAALKQLIAKTETGVTETRNLVDPNQFDSARSEVSAVSVVIGEWRAQESTRRYIMVRSNLSAKEQQWRAAIESGLEQLRGLVADIVRLVENFTAGVQRAESNVSKIAASLKAVRSAYRDCSDKQHGAGEEHRHDD